VCKDEAIQQINRAQVALDTIVDLLGAGDEIDRFGMEVLLCLISERLERGIVALQAHCD